MSAAAALDALGHPTRRLIIEALQPGPLPVGVLAGRLPISRPAVSQHLRVLKAANLVQETVVGTRHEYRIDQTGLRSVQAYLEQFWEATLGAFATLAESQAATSHASGSTPEGSRHSNFTTTDDLGRTDGH